jgi:peptidoglycan/xylan/chitin deacetylase (PgdA/CDA1 family)
VSGTSTLMNGHAPGGGLRLWRRRCKMRLLSAASSAASALLGPLEDNAFGILMYHRIVEPLPGFARPKYNVPPSRFEAQVRGLLARGFEAWPLRKVLAHHRAGQAIPRRAFVVTFDDGFDNVYEFAWPILKRLGVPATIFLATAYLDSPDAFPMDDWALAGSDRVPAVCWRPLTTSHCREMQAGGLVELAAHTHTHQDFRQRARAFGEDLQRCLAELRGRFGVESPTFAFPFGEKELGFANAELAAVARGVGVLCALTTESKLVRPGADCFDLGRLMPEDFDTDASLAAKLGGWHDRLRGLGRLVLRRERARLAFP